MDAADDIDCYYDQDYNKNYYCCYYCNNYDVDDAADSDVVDSHDNYCYNDGCFGVVHGDYQGEVGDLDNQDDMMMI